MKRTFSAALCLGTMLAASVARAETAPVAVEMQVAKPFRPSFHIAALVATTLAYLPHSGSMQGPQNDSTILVAVGMMVHPKLALQLAFGPTLIGDHFVGLTLLPGLVWLFSSHLYAAARFTISVLPQANFGFLPCLGVTHVFKNGFQPFVEAGVSSNVGRGAPDFGVGLNIGAAIHL